MAIEAEGTGGIGISASSISDRYRSISVPDWCTHIPASGILKNGVSAKVFEIN
jgi:hypothetical protein